MTTEMTKQCYIALRNETVLSGIVGSVTYTAIQYRPTDPTEHFLWGGGGGVVHHWQIHCRWIIFSRERSKVSSSGKTWAVVPTPAEICNKFICLRLQYSGLYRHVVRREPDVSEEHCLSSGPKRIKKPAEAAQLNLPPASPDFLLGLLFNRVDGGDTLLRNIGPCPTSWPYNSGDRTLCSHRCECLKSSIVGGYSYLYHDRCEQHDYVLAMCLFVYLYCDMRKRRTIGKSHPSPPELEFPTPIAILCVSCALLVYSSTPHDAGRRLHENSGKYAADCATSHPR
jgi:hypothetical protein